MRSSRVAVPLACAAWTAVLFNACAPLLSYDDLTLAPPSEGGADRGGTTDAAPGDATASMDAGEDAAPRGDGGDLCVNAVPNDGGDVWYCERVLSPTSTTPSRLWKCNDQVRVDVTACPFGCFQAPPGFADLCAFCNLGDGNYCPSEFSTVYANGGEAAGRDTFVVHCAAGAPLPASTPCDGGCVRAAPSSHCP